MRGLVRHMNKLPTKARKLVAITLTGERKGPGTGPSPTTCSHTHTNAMSKAEDPEIKRATPKSRAKATVERDEYENFEDASGGPFFELQRPLVHLIEEYLATHPVDGKRMQIKTFCEAAGVSPSNVTAIITGTRWAGNCTRDTVEALSNMLEIPVLQFYILCGFIKSEDVVFNVNIEETLDAIYRMMMRDKRVSYRVPRQEVWDAWPMSAKLSMCMMYEALIDKVLLRYASR